MELDTRKIESKSDLKQQSIAIEEVLNKAIVQLGDLRASMEEVKWDNMRKAVGAPLPLPLVPLPHPHLLAALGAFLVLIIFSLELYQFNRQRAHPPPAETRHPEAGDDEMLHS